MSKETLLIELENQFLSGQKTADEFWKTRNSLNPLPKGYKTKEWKLAREKVIGSECELCGSKKILTIQHRWHPRSYSQIEKGLLKARHPKNRVKKSNRLKKRAILIFIEEGREYRRLTNPNFITACRDCAFKEDRALGFISKDKLTAKEKFDNEKKRFSSPSEMSRIKEEKKATLTRMIKRRNKK